MIYYSGQLLFDYKTDRTAQITGHQPDDTNTPSNNITLAPTNDSLDTIPTGQLSFNERSSAIGDRWSIHKPLIQWSLSLMISTLIFPVILHVCCFRLERLGIQIRVATSYLIFRKAVKLSHATLVKSTIGQMVNLLSNDVDRFDLVATFVPYVWIAPMQVILTMSILWSIIGSNSLILLLILFIFMCIQSYLSQKFSYFRTTIANLTDIRARYINEVITAIKVVKTHAWERHWYEKITKARNNEMKAIKDVSFYRAFIQSGAYFSSKIIVFGVLATAALSGTIQNNIMNPWNVFLIITLLNEVQATVSRFLPLTISFLSEMMVSIKRIEVSE